MMIQVVYPDVPNRFLGFWGVFWSLWEPLREGGYWVTRDSGFGSNRKTSLTKVVQDSFVINLTRSAVGIGPSYISKSVPNRFQSVPNELKLAQNEKLLIQKLSRMVK